RIELGRRTIVMPNRIAVDTRAPTIRVTRTTRRVISPDGDGRFDGITIAYAVDEPAHAVLDVGRARYEERRGLGTSGTFRWFGRLGGRTLRPGTYRLTITAEDAAGNVSKPTPRVAVRIRFVELARHVVRVRAGTRFG